MAQLKFSKQFKKRIYTVSLLYFISSMYSSQGFANTLLTVPPNQAGGVALTQDPIPTPPNTAYNSLDVQASGSVTPHVGVNFNQGNGVPITIQIEGGATPGTIFHNVIDGGITISSTAGGDPNAQLWIVNSGIIRDIQNPVFDLQTSSPIRIYNLATPGAGGHAPASIIAPNAINFLPFINNPPFYVQLGVNTALQQDMLPAIIRNPPFGPSTQPLGGNGNADAVSPDTPFVTLMTGQTTTLFVQGTFNLQNSLIGNGGHAGIIRANTYAGSPGFTISSVAGSVVAPIDQFSQEGGMTNIITNGNVTTTLYRGLGGLLTVTGGGRLNATTLNNNAGANITNNVSSSIITTTTTNSGTISSSGTFTATTLQNSNLFNANSGSTLNLTNLQNFGTFNLATNLSIAGNNFSNIGTFNNNGALTITGTALVNNGIFNNNGALTLSANTIQNFGSFSANRGSTINGLTTLQNSGTFNLAINLGIAGNSFLNTGTFNINSGGRLTETAGNPLSNNGLLNINSGGVLSAVTFNNLGTVNYNPGSSFINTTLNNSGTFNVNGDPVFSNTNLNNSGIFNAFSGSTVITQNLNNSGVFNAYPGSTLAITNLRNSGTFNLGTSLSISGASFSNSGTFNINSGGALAVATIGFINTGTVSLNPGGSFTGTILGNGGSSTFNINTSLTTGPTVVIGNSFAPLGVVNLSPGSTLALNNSLFANTFNNNGSLVLTSSQVLSGNYFQGSGASLMTTIQSGTPVYGQLVVGGLATVGGAINVNYTDFGIGIADGQTFDIITSNGLTDNNPAIVSPSNPFLTFIRDRNSGSPNNVTIRAVRGNPVADNPSIAGVANTIQYLFGHVNQFPIFLPLLQKIAGNPGGIVANLTQLIPVVNGMESIPALYNPYPLFDKILKRANFRRRLASNQLSFDDELNQGYTAGDMIGYNNSFGPIFFGNAISQGGRDNIAGYNASTLGLALVGDTPINYYSSIGAGMSYSGTTSKSNCNINTARIENIQAMVYGSIDYMNAIFLDGVASLGQNFFKTKRTISIVSETANANFSGLQPSLKARAGINFIIFDFELTPLGTVYYSKVKEKKHTEKGAPITGLTIQAHRVKLLQFGTGLKLAWVREAYNFVPEIHALWLKNTKNPQFAFLSQFVEGGPPFLAVGPSFPSQGLDVGGSLTMRMSECFLFMGSFDFEFRKQGFLAQTLGLKFRVLF